jgi:hypothetical protein
METATPRLLSFQFGRPPVAVPAVPSMAVLELRNSLLPVRNFDQGAGMNNRFPRQASSIRTAMNRRGGRGAKPKRSNGTSEPRKGGFRARRGPEFSTRACFERARIANFGHWSERRSPHWVGGGTVNLGSRGLPRDVHGDPSRLALVSIFAPWPQFRCRGSIRCRGSRCTRARARWRPDDVATWHWVASPSRREAA